MVFKKQKRENCDKIIEDDFTKCDMKTEHKQQKKTRKVTAEWNRTRGCDGNNKNPDSVTHAVRERDDKTDI